MKAKLRRLSAIQKSFEEQHYQKQFTQCWERYGSISSATQANNNQGRQHYKVPKERGKRSREEDEGTTSAVSARNQPPTTRGPVVPPRSAEIIHDLHLVGACEDHETDVSSCDEYIAKEQTRARQLITRLHVETRNVSETVVSSSARRPNPSVAQSLRDDATQAAAHSDLIKNKEQLISESAAKNIHAVRERQRSKRLLEHGLYKVLHTPPYLQRSRRGVPKGPSTASGSLVSQATFRLGNLASVTTTERTEDSSASSQQAKLLTSIDRFRARATQLKTLRKQSSFLELGPIERVQHELATVMKKRREFHRARGQHHQQVHAFEHVESGGTDEEFEGGDE